MNLKGHEFSYSLPKNEAKKTKIGPKKALNPWKWGKNKKIGPKKALNLFLKLDS